MSWRVTLHCTRSEAEVLPEGDDLFAYSEAPPVIVADEPDPHRPNEWRIYAYFEEQPTTQELILLRRLAAGSDPEIEHLGETDWVTLSQAGLEPIVAGRFFVHTPTHRDTIPEGAIAFEIDAGLAFGTGQHATTAGCLAALDKLQAEGANFSNFADIGTGTGLLAFAAMALWPGARALATDIDPISIEVTRENAAVNGIGLGANFTKLLVAVAEGMDSPVIAARAPFDLLIANILAGPLIDLAPSFARAVCPGATLVLAGLLDSQADAVVAAYVAQGMTVAERGAGEWCVLMLTAAQ